MPGPQADLWPPACENRPAAPWWSRDTSVVPRNRGASAKDNLGRQNSCTNQPGWYWRASPWSPLRSALPVPRRISLSCGAVGLELKLCQEGADAWAKSDRQRGQGDLDPELGHRAAGALPAAAGRQFARHRRVSDRRDLAGHPRQPLHRPHRQDPGRGSRIRTSRQIVDNNTVGGKLVAMPWFTDAGMLFYRKDLLEAAGKQPPQTWQELTATANELQDEEPAPRATTGCGASSTRARPMKG